MLLGSSCPYPRLILDENRCLMVMMMMARCDTLWQEEGVKCWQKKRYIIVEQPLISNYIFLIRTLPVGLLSSHGSHFWVCITFCKVRHGDSVTKPDYYYYYCQIWLYIWLSWNNKFVAYELKIFVHLELFKKRVQIMKMVGYRKIKNNQLVLVLVLEEVCLIDTKLLTVLISILRDWKRELEKFATI